MLQEIAIRGFLSYGWETTRLSLRPLNLLIGPNGSGKTNLLDILDLLHAAPGDLLAPSVYKGGAGTWLYNGPGGDGQGMIEVVLDGPRLPLRYRLSIPIVDGEPQSAQEVLESRDGFPGEDPFLFMLCHEGQASWKYFGDLPEGGLRPPRRIDVPNLGQYLPLSTQIGKSTALSTLRTPQPGLPEINHLAEQLSGIRLWQGWTLGPNSPVRKPADAGLPGRYLEPDGSNLALLLHRLRQDGATWTEFRRYLQTPYPNLDDIETSAEGAFVKYFAREKGRAVPATRLSDGTLRWLGLLCLLLDPTPPPLLCIEEPEIGLHPDLLVTLADLLRGATKRTQILVTTHSDALVSAFSESPEDVVICEQGPHGSVLRRLQEADLEVWLDTYSLGDAWLRNAFGGKRW